MIIIFLKENVIFCTNIDLNVHRLELRGFLIPKCCFSENESHSVVILYKIKTPCLNEFVFMFGFGLTGVISKAKRKGDYLGRDYRLKLINILRKYAIGKIIHVIKTKRI